MGAFKKIIVTWTSKGLLVHTYSWWLGLLLSLSKTSWDLVGAWKGFMCWGYELRISKCHNPTNGLRRKRLEEKKTRVNWFFMFHSFLFHSYCLVHYMTSCCYLRFHRSLLLAIRWLLIWHCPHFLVTPHSSNITSFTNKPTHNKIPNSNGWWTDGTLASLG